MGLSEVINNKGSSSRYRWSHFRLPPAAPLHCLIVLPLAPSLLPLAPSLLPLKQLCSLSRTKTAIPDPQFGAYIMYIYILVNHSRKQENKKTRKQEKKKKKSIKPRYSSVLVPLAIGASSRLFSSWGWRERG